MTSTKPYKRYVFAFGAGGLAFVSLGLALGFAAASGPLDPPAEAVDGSGEPVSTQPSLAEIEAKIDALASTSNGLTEGPWEVAWFASAPNPVDQLTPVEIVPGRVLVHQMMVYRANLVLFDGPGQMSAAFRIESGDLVGSARHDYLFGTGGNGQGQDATQTYTLDVVADSGLYWAYDLRASGAVVQVLYRQLDP